MGAVLISTPGDVSLNPSCEAAIYENLQQLSKTKQFKQVFRGGDRSANDVPECAVCWVPQAQYHLVLRDTYRVAS
jgi:hypothetical protein